MPNKRLIRNRKNECPNHEVYVVYKISTMFPKIYDRHNCTRKKYSSEQVFYETNILAPFETLPKSSSINFSFTLGSRHSFPLSQNFSSVEHKKKIISSSWNKLIFRLLHMKGIMLKEKKKLDQLVNNWNHRQWRINWNWLNYLKNWKLENCLLQ